MVWYNSNSLAYASELFFLCINGYIRYWRFIGAAGRNSFSVSSFAKQGGEPVSWITATCIQRDFDAQYVRVEWVGAVHRVAALFHPCITIALVFLREDEFVSGLSP